MQEILGTFLTTEIPEETQDFWIITVTETRISPDFSYVDFYVSSLKNSDMLTKFLAAYWPQLQGMIGKKIALRKVPKVRFRYDDTGEKSSEIYNTIKDISIN